MKICIAPRTGLTLESPVIAASGALGYGIELAGRTDLHGLGALVCKGTTRAPRSGNEPVRMLETPAGMLNAIGLQNVGVEAVVREMAPRWAALPVPVLVNVSATSVAEYREIVEMLDGVDGIAGIELNISCPNVKEDGAMFGSAARPAHDVTSALRERTDLPLVVKLTPNVSDIRPIAEAVEEAGADAVTVANTLYGMAIEIRRRQPALLNVTGGLSGPAVKPHILYLVHQTAQSVSIPVIAAGGVMTAEDALEYIMAGACAVEMATALLVDPLAWKRVAADLEAWCRRAGVRDMHEIIGAANSGFKRKPGEVNLAG